MRPTTVRLSSADEAHLAAVAAQRGCSVSAVIRELVGRDRAGQPPADPRPAVADRDEALALLTEAARDGSVTAMRALLAVQRAPETTEATRDGIIDVLAARRRLRSKET